MRFLALIGLCFSVLARAQSLVALPPVDAPAPVEAADDEAHSSPARRDPAASTSAVLPSAHAGEAKDAATLLAPIPGVQVSTFAGLGHGASVSFRGAASSGSLVLLDGVPLGGPGESVDLSTLPPAAVQRFELVRGGARYGPGALGGVLNVVTLPPSGDPALFAEATTGAFETVLASAGARGRLLGGQTLFLAHGLSTRGNFDYAYRPLAQLEGGPVEARTRVNNQALQGGVLFRHRAELPREIRLDTVLDGLAFSRGLAGTVDNPTPDAHEQAQRLVLSARARRRLGGSGELEATLWGRVRRSVFSGTVLQNGAYQQIDSGAGLELSYSQLLFGWHGLSVVAGAGADGLAGATAAPLWPRLYGMLRDEVLLANGDLTVDVSVRVDRSGPFTGFSPKLGALWLLPQGFEVKLNAGQAWRPPSFFERYVQQGRLIPNADLRPERGLYVDGAVAFRREAFTAQAGGFYALYQDLISYEYYPPLLARPVNFSAARVMGVEVEAQFVPRPWLSASASYTLLETRNLKDDPRYYLNPLPYRPQHKVFARAVLGPRWLNARGEVLFQSEQFVNRVAARSLPARALVGVGAFCELLRRPQLSLAFDVKNLLDTQGMDVDGYPLPPRAAYLTLGLELDFT